MAMGKLPARSARISLLLLGLVAPALFLVFLYRPSLSASWRDFVPLSSRPSLASPGARPSSSAPVSAVRVPCKGPRGTDIDDQTLQGVSLLPSSPPRPVGGSYDVLGLPLTYHTPRTKYGAYGLYEDLPWHEVDWALLQNECLARNRDRFRDQSNITTLRRFSVRDKKPPTLKTSTVTTGRTAIVLRAWEGFEYTPIDFYHIRSLIVETALASNADYTVFLLVDVKDENNTRRIFHDPAGYDRALQDLVPPEFRHMAVLFDAELLHLAYPNVHDHSVFFQVFQPLQLFAQLYPGFDHYWQLEMDMKITGNGRIWLDAMARFACKEPRKQAVERSSYFYMPHAHGTYDQFRAAVNESVHGGSAVWGPVTIPEIPKPIGPAPPVPDPRDDDFAWGVGDDADLILTNALADIRAAKFWPFMDWINGFADKLLTPRYYSSIAMGRYSWNLLNAMYHAQAVQGLSLPSEASPVSFALYHGLKVAFPPHPWYHHPQANRDVDRDELNQLFNGGSPADIAATNNGLAFGRAMYDPKGVYELFNGGTWWWVPGFPGRIVKQWMHQDAKDLPGMLRHVDGQVWAPMMAMHPVKHDDGINL